MIAEGRVNAPQAAMAPGMPPTRHADRVGNLTASRAGKKLAERHQINKGFLGEPLPSFYKFLPKITKMSDRSAKRC